MIETSSTMTRLSPQVFLFDVGSVATRPAVGDSALVLAQHPSQAFGDGSHPTTRLMTAATDHICRIEKPARVLDVGTGTGVLARVARARSATRVVATDIDPIALEASRANAALDSAGVEIEISDQPPDTWGASFDLVLANILEQPLRILAPALSRALAPQGTLLLSGFTRLQTPALRTAYEGLGLHFVSESSDDGWVILAFRSTA